MYVSVFSADRIPGKNVFAMLAFFPQMHFEGIDDE
jgi:hypothetical protein